MITEHRLILGDLLSPAENMVENKVALAERPRLPDQRATQILPEVLLEDSLVTAAQKWRERLGRDETPLPKPGSAAQKWRERLAEPQAPTLLVPAPRKPAARRSWFQRWFAATPATPETQAKPAESEQRRQPGGRLPPELEGDTPVLDACRLLKLNLPGTRQHMAPLVLIAPDSERQCGMVAAGLALALAEDGMRTLLVDADMRAPTFHALFGFQPRPGLAETLAAGSARSLPVAPVAGRLWLLPAGNARPMPALHRMPALGTVTTELAQQFDAVIYHIGGLHRPAEALQLAMHVGSVLFTLRAGIDTPQPVRRMHGTLERAGVSVLGFALVGGEE